MSRFHVLGSGARGPSPQRQTASYLLETRRGWILLDAGSGISRLHDPLFREMAARYRRAWVLLGDYTHDRLSGLPNLLQFLGGMEVIVAGPGDVEETVGRYLAEPFFRGGLSAWCGAFSGGVSFASLRPGDNRVAGEIIEVLESRAGAPVALRVRDVSYTPEVEITDSLQGFVAGSSLLLRDVHLEAAGASTGSASVSAVSGLAERAGVQDLVIGHFPGDLEGGALEQLQFQAAAHFPRVVVAMDMMCLKLTGGPEEEPEIAEPPGEVGIDAEDMADQESEELQAGGGTVAEPGNVSESHRGEAKGS